MIRWLRYFGFRALRNVREEWGLNLRVVVGFALMLVIVGLFLLLGSNLGHLLERWGEQLQVTAYLKKGVSEKEAEKIRATMESLPEVRKATYVSQAVALHRFRSDLGGLAGVLEGLEENPLPASIELQLPSEGQEASKVASLAEDLKAFDGVEEVQYGQQWVERYRVFLETFSVLGMGLALILLFVGWGSISNLIQLTVFARKEEIEILKLVGATDRFVRAPFLIEGLLQGLAASLLALFLLYVLFASTLLRVADALGGFFGRFEIFFLSAGQMLFLVVASVFLSLFASFVATGRHMDV